MFVAGLDYIVMLAPLVDQRKRGRRVSVGAVLMDGPVVDRAWQYLQLKVAGV